MFTIPTQDEDASPWPIFERLLQTHDELAELRDMVEAEIRVAFMFRFGEWTRADKCILGMCCTPAVQGVLRDLFYQMLEHTLGYMPDFIILLNGEWWADASERQREILVFHEAQHAGHARDKFGGLKFHRITGRPITCIRGHDVEEFTSVVRRYGGWKSDLAEFLAAAAGDPESSKAPVF
jgi:hypothetical protein